MVELLPAETALLVIDPQNAFCHPDGTLGVSGVPMEPLVAPIAPIRRLIEACRAAGVVDIWTRHLNHADDPGRLAHRITPHTSKRRKVAAQPGTWDAEFVGELNDLAPADRIVTKHRWSAFYATNLEARLRVLGARLVIVCGSTTNACIDTTVRDAYMRDFDVVIPRSCVGGVRGDWHETALAVLAQYAGEVVELEEIEAQLAPATVGA